MKNKRMLAIGAGRFIGSYLCEKLAKLTAEITAPVRYNSKGSHGFLEASPREIKDLIKVVLGDI